MPADSGTRKSNDVSKDILSSKIAAARTEIADAESALEKIVSEIDLAPRAEKTTVTAVVEDAFTKLRAARLHLEELEALLNR